MWSAASREVGNSRPRAPQFTGFSAGVSGSPLAPPATLRAVLVFALPFAFHFGLAVVLALLAELARVMGFRVGASAPSGVQKRQPLRAPPPP
jgi:hypothetical protein